MSQHQLFSYVSKIISLIDFTSTTFDYIANQVYLQGTCTNLLAICGTGSIRIKIKLFDLLNRFVINSSVLFIIGKFNIHLERHDDPNNVTFIGILSSLGLRLRVDGPTHDLGGTLDVVLQKKNCHQYVVVEKVDSF